METSPQVLSKSTNRFKEMGITSPQNGVQGSRIKPPQIKAHQSSSLPASVFLEGPISDRNRIHTPRSKSVKSPPQCSPKDPSLPRALGRDTHERWTGGGWAQGAAADPKGTGGGASGRQMPIGRIRRRWQPSSCRPLRPDDIEGWSGRNRFLFKTRGGSGRDPTKGSRG